MNIKKNTPFWDAALPIEKRLDWLLEEMTIEEKLSCLSSGAPDLERLGIPGMSLGGEAAHGIEGRNDQNDLGAPDVSTSFVQPIGMSASWDTDLIRQAGRVAGVEGRVIYHRHPDRGLSRWAPTVDLERDPRWGRTEEGYGEDPLLTGEMASAYIQGIQGEDPHYLRVAATLKHFYGNNTEAGRGWKNSSIDPRNKYELYLEPFRRCIEKGHAQGVMTAYNKINGVPGILNREVQDILKDQYGLTHAVSDGGAMELVEAFHHWYGMDAETVANAIKAGVDAMSDNPAAVEAAAREAWELGLMTEAEIDRAIRNVFRTKLRLGIYDEPVCNPFDAVTEANIDSPEHRAICRQMSREAICLLKNEKECLPLSSQTSPEDLALIGPMADVWYQDWYGGTAPFTRTLKEGLEEVLAGGKTVTDRSKAVRDLDLAAPDRSKEVHAPDLSCADGLDRVVLKYECGGVEKGIAVDDDGSLILGDDPEIFVRQDWGEGSITYRSVRTGKYMNVRFYAEKYSADELGMIAAEKEEIFDWFVMEIFHEIPCGENQVILTDRFDMPLQVCEDGHLRSIREGEGSPLKIEVVQSGLQKARRLAAEKKMVILALGCCSMINAKEEVDRTTIELPPDQEELMRAVCEENPNTVLVLFSNYPCAIGEAQKKLPAILWSATGAQDMGTAMAETLFGINAPAGRLNLTWYRDDSQLPDIDNYDLIKYGRTYRYFEGEVLYPFGYGQTYTDFVYSDLKVILEDSTKLKVTFIVTNNGQYTSDEVAQVYAVPPASRMKKPRRQLVGFERLKAILPGECRKVEMLISIKELHFYDVISASLMVEEGSYTIFAGSCSLDDSLSVKVDIPGQKPGKRDLRGRIRADHYDDYENIKLVEGQYGYTAVTPETPDCQAVLTYRDCKLKDEVQALSLHAKSEVGGSIELRINGKHIASWEGNTRTFEKKPRLAMGEAGKTDKAARKATWQPVYADICFRLRAETKDSVGTIQAAPGQIIDTQLPEGQAEDLQLQESLDMETKVQERPEGGITDGIPETDDPVRLDIILTGDVKLCWFKGEKTSFFSKFN